MGSLDRELFAGWINRQLVAAEDRLTREWAASGPINHFVVDDLLPAEWTRQIHRAFPPSEAMTLRSSLRERKYVSAQMSRFEALLEETIYAFQDSMVVRSIERITGLQALEPDPLLYAGGISLMAPGHFLNPHVDNSHDKFRARYRVLNLLYYVTPDWSLERGGNLELWPSGPKGKPLTLESSFNRLVVMVTHRGSWHSVSPNASNQNRCCVSNYYFSEKPIGEVDYFHVTSFRGRPEQPLRDIALRADIMMRTAVRMFFPKGIKQNAHYYRK